MAAPAIGVTCTLVAVMLLGCSQSPSDDDATSTSGERPVDSTDLVTVAGLVLVGPVGPPTRDDPEPGSEPLAEAQIDVLIDDDLVIVLTSDRDGRVEARLEPGGYRFVPRPHPDAMGTPAEQRIAVVQGFDEELVFEYDTGIR